MTRKKDPTRGMSAEEKIDYLEKQRDERDRELDAAAEDAMRDLDEKIKAMQQEKKRIKAKASASARKRRNHRLITGAATVESIAGELGDADWRYIGNVMRSIRVDGMDPERVAVAAAARAGEESYQTLKARESAPVDKGTVPAVPVESGQGRLL